MSVVSWPAEFAAVIGCAACTQGTDRKLLRDAAENVPQPGYVGANYGSRRVVLVGQNPGVPGALASRDRPYTAALRALKASPDAQTYQALHRVQAAFIPQWPVHGSYFPLSECGLTLQDIAYFNLVRCRTQGNAAPGTRLTATCRDRHFGRWLDLLAPRVVVFIGKWASDNASTLVAERGIAHAFMNRQRSLSTFERHQNRQAVVALVRRLAFEGAS